VLTKDYVIKFYKIYFFIPLDVIQHLILIFQNE